MCPGLHSPRSGSDRVGQEHIPADAAVAGKAVMRRAAKLDRLGPNPAAGSPGMACFGSLPWVRSPACGSRRLRSLATLPVAKVDQPPDPQVVIGIAVMHGGLRGQPDHGIPGLDPRIGPRASRSAPRPWPRRHGACRLGLALVEGLEDDSPAGPVPRSRRQARRSAPACRSGSVPSRPAMSRDHRRTRGQNCPAAACRRPAGLRDRIGTPRCRRPAAQARR